jgi:SAM-dependent methyltransferase
MLDPEANRNRQIYGHRWSAAELARAALVWEVLATDFFQPMISRQDRVLDVGCGFFHFLNHIKAAERVGIDANPDVAAHAAAGVQFYRTADLTLREMPDRHFDFIFLSNILEHLDNSDAVLHLLARTSELLSERGKLAILQPNFRLLGARYFDFIDHKTILTDVSLQEALELCGFAVVRKIVRFLPYTTKSRLPAHPALVRAYLRFPPAWWFFGKQSLFIGSVNATVDA